MKTYSEFILIGVFESIDRNDNSNFIEIFNSIYEYHLTKSERTLLNEFNYSLNESWFSDLKDKSERGVLKIRSQAGELLTQVAQKAKDVLNFVKMIATQIKDAVVNMIKNSVNTFKSKIIPQPELLSLISEYMTKKGDNLKKWLSGAGELIKFVMVDLPVKLFNKLINFLKGVFSKGSNEGFNYFCNDFLNEGNEVEEKSFLQKLGDKIASFPPFSWIPKMEEMVKYGLYKVKQFIEKFFVWIDKDDAVTEAIDLFRDKSKFTRGIAFLFDLLEIYIIYKFNEKIGNKIEAFKKSLKDGDISQYLEEIKNKPMDEIFQKIGFSPEQIINSVKSIAEKIPYVSDILSILKNLALAIGVYQVIQPTLAKIK